MGFIKPAPVATPESWKRVTLDAADSTADPSSLVVGSPTDDGTKTTVTIDRNQGAAKLIPSLAAMWYFDTDVQAQDQISLGWTIEIHNHATLQSSQICVYAGVTSDVTTPDTYHYGGGASYQLANIRHRRFKGSTMSVGAQVATARGVACQLIKSGGANANCGNVGSNVIAQYLDASYDGVNSWHSVSASQTTAAAGTDGIKFFIGIGIVGSVASNVDVEFAVYRAPIIKRV